MAVKINVSMLNDKCLVTMPESIENYVSPTVTVRMRRRAIIVWSVFALLAAVWVLLILLAPLAEANNFSNIANPLYKFFGYLCHQMSDRSFHVHEHAFAVCARCFGVYCGLLFGFVVYPLLQRIEETAPLPRFWLFLAMIPIAIDWLLGIFEIWENTHLSRFVTGAILGTVCAVFIVPALVEVFQFRPTREQVKRLSS